MARFTVQSEVAGTVWKVEVSVGDAVQADQREASQHHVEHCRRREKDPQQAARQHQYSTPAEAGVLWPQTVGQAHGQKQARSRKYW